jgi:hypothetical protein
VLAIGAIEAGAMTNVVLMRLTAATADRLAAAAALPIALNIDNRYGYIDQEVTLKKTQKSRKTRRTCRAASTGCGDDVS